jgi:uncharacterized protein YdhG (YjbR/CyaY superfamily)
MAEKKPAKKSSTRSAKTATKKTSRGLTSDERAAMKERLQELKTERSGKADGESEVLAAIAKMPEPDRAMAKRVHAIVKASAPALSPKTWYGMPAYARNGKVVFFFRGASKFKERYAMFGFNDTANLDSGSMWPIAYALKELTAADEKKIAALVKKAVS